MSNIGETAALSRAARPASPMCPSTSSTAAPAMRDSRMFDCGVPRARHDEPLRAELLGPRDGRRHAPRLERRRRVLALVLDEQVPAPQRRAELLGAQQRRPALAQRHLERAVAHRQHLAVPPHRRLPRRDVGGRHGIRCRGQVVPGVEHLAAGRAQGLQHVGVMALPTARALQVGQEVAHVDIPSEIRTGHDSIGPCPH